MGKQEKLISADKLLEWLEEVFKAHIMMHQTERAHAYKDVLTEIRSGKFNPDPVPPTIEPGDQYYKCDKCNKLSSEHAWNHATRMSFGDNIALIGEPGARDAYFTCPKCGIESEYYELEVANDE